MLRPEDNELVTQVGPGTPMGETLRRHWIPGLLAEEIPDPGCAPVRTRLLGENLIAFRTQDGKVSVIQEACPHRGASLFFGRNEGTDSRDGTMGVRCSYHGWKFNGEGSCIDMPTEPAESTFKDKIKITAYPAKERGDVIWVYMGPEGTAPPLPELEWAMVPETHRFVSKRIQRCSFLQAMEGGIDSSHVSFLHSDAPLWSPQWTHQLDGPRKHLAKGNPKFFIEPTDYGMLLGARRETNDGDYYWRVTQWLMPWYTMVPRDEQEPIAGHAWVPIDDENCFTWNISYVPERPLHKVELDYYRNGGHIHARKKPGSPFETEANAGNDYLIDRTLQKAGISQSGIEGIAMQDVAMQESMGPIVDRMAENLATSDAGIIAARRRLISEAKAHHESGATPSGLNPVHHRVRSTSAVLPADTSWVDATAESRKAGAEHYAN